MMNRTFAAVYKTAALLRLLLVVAVYVLDQLRWQYRNRGGLFPDGIHIEFDGYVYVIITLIILLLATVTLFQNAAAFVPQKIKGLLRSRGFVWFIWAVELLFAAGLAWMAFEEVRSEFFPPAPTVMDTIFSPFIAADNTALAGILKIAAVNYCLLTLLFLFFVCCLWRYRNGWLRGGMVPGSR